MSRKTLPCGHPTACRRKEPSHWGGDGPSGFSLVCGWCADVAEVARVLKEHRDVGEALANVCYNFGHGTAPDGRARATAAQLAGKWDDLAGWQGLCPLAEAPPEGVAGE